MSDRIIKIHQSDDNKNIAITNYFGQNFLEKTGRRPVSEFIFWTGENYKYMVNNGVYFK